MELTHIFTIYYRYKEISGKNGGYVRTGERLGYIQKPTVAVKLILEIQSVQLGRISNGKSVTVELLP